MSSSKEKEPNLKDECGNAAAGWGEYPLTYTDNNSVFSITPDSSSLSTAATFYDSGNFSSHSNVTDNSSASLEMETQTQYVHHTQQEQCEKEQSLFVALQDVRTLRSQLERLSKSEQWYKKELRAQKCTRLDAMERLYAQERKYMQENQRLQRECVRLYEKCANIEKEFEASKVKAVKLCEEQQRRTTDLAFCQDVNVFEIEQQKAIIDDQQALIDVLRKQKQALIVDLKRLAEERDEKILELQLTLAGCEVDNNRMVSKCKELMHQRKDLQKTIDEKEIQYLSENAEKLKVENLVNDLRAELQIKEDLLKHKEEQILELQNEFKNNLTKEANIDEVHRLSMTYHKEINDKTRELAQLKCTLIQLREELDSFGELKTKNEQQERQIEHINFLLDTRQLELAQLQKTNVEKTEQISELHVILEQHRGEKNVALEELLTTQTSLKALERELIVLNEQYANLCALHERTKFELELRMIEQGKLNFRTEQDKLEVEQLRSRLSTYLKQTSELSARIVELEAKLDMKEEEKLDLETKNENEIRSAEENKNVVVIEDEKECTLNEDVLKNPRGKDNSNFLKDAEKNFTDDLKSIEESTKSSNTAHFNASAGINLKELHVEPEELNLIDNEIDTFQSSLSTEEELGLKIDKKITAVMNKENVLNNLLSAGYLKEDVDPNFIAKAIEIVQKQDTTKQRKSENSTSVIEKIRESSMLCRENMWNENDSSNQSSVMNTKTKLFETLEEIMRTHNEQKAPSLSQDVVNLSAVMQENEELKENLAKASRNEEILKLQAQLEHKSLAKEKLELKLEKQYDDLQTLRKAFLKKDAVLYKCEKVAKYNEEQRNLLETQNEINEELKVKCDSLQIMVNNLEASNSATAQELNASRELAVNVKEQFEVAKKDVEKQNSIIAAQQVRIENLTKDAISSEEHITLPILERFEKEIQTEPTDIDTYIASKSIFTEVEAPTNTIKKDVATYIRGVIPVFLDAEQHTQLTNSTKQIRILSQQEDHDLLLNSANKYYDEEHSKSLEIKNLKAHILELEEQLLSKTVSDVENNKKRIDMLAEFLEFKNNKIQQINETKADWEELLLALNTAQELEEKNRNELELKNVELEELNQIFAEQNIEIQELLQLLQLTEQQYRTEQLKDKSKYEQSLAVLEETLNEKIKENEKLELLIAELNSDNEKLQNDVNEINYKFSSEHDEAMNLLQTKIEALTIERDEYHKKIHELKTQLSSQEVNKRNAIFFPTIIADLNEENTMSSCSDSETTTSTKSSDDHLRILTKVLESEYKRKIQRYDLHTNTMLKNIKSLKKSLRATKQKAALLREQQKKTEEDLCDLQTTKMLLEEMRLKYAQSQLKIKTLEQTLESERKKFEASDIGKSAREEPVHEVPNLIDDYKKLIQQSAVNTGRPKTSAVLDLIKRSNQCVPNMSKLETNIYELRNDFEKYIMNYTQHGGKFLSYAIQKETPSLMEELLAAADNY